jgi:hypothetical protein
MAVVCHESAEMQRMTMTTGRWRCSDKPTCRLRVDRTKDDLSIVTVDGKQSKKPIVL